MEEKIKGLYDSVIALAEKYSSYNKIRDEYAIVFNASACLSDTENSNLQEFNKLNQERLQLIKEYLELAEIKEDYLKKKKKMQTAFTEKAKDMKKETHLLNEEKEYYKSQVCDLEKRFSHVSEELKKHKGKERKSIYSANEELLCAKCLCSYYENENFNWSCRTHRSQFSGDRYWCCNLIGKDTPGCILSKHITKEELLEKNRKNNNAVKYCIGCRDIGHSVADCPKDPNIRTNITPNEELTRLKTFKKIKRKNLSNSDLHIKAFAMVSDKLQGGEFRKEIDSEDEGEEMEGIYFRDVMDIKEHLVFPNNNSCTIESCFNESGTKEKSLFEKMKLKNIIFK